MSQTPENETVAQSTTDRPLPVPTDVHRAGLSMGAAPAEAAITAPTPTAAAPMPAGAEPRSSFAEEVHQYIREYIQLADQKATFFFTGATALLAFLYNEDVSARWLKPVATWSVMDGIAFLSMALLAVSAFLAILVVIPRTPGSKRGIVFFEAIAEFDTGRRYADSLAAMTTEALFQEKAEHCHVLATVCRRKYARLRTALWIGAVGLAASLLVFLFA